MNKYEIEKLFQNYKGPFTNQDAQKHQVLHSIVLGQEERNKKHRKHVIEFVSASIGSVALASAFAVYLFVVALPVLTPDKILAKAGEYISTAEKDGPIRYQESITTSTVSFRGKQSSIVHKVKDIRNTQTGDFRDTTTDFGVEQTWAHIGGKLYDDEPLKNSEELFPPTNYDPNFYASVQEYIDDLNKKYPEKVIEMVKTENGSAGVIEQGNPVINDANKLFYQLFDNGLSGNYDGKEIVKKLQEDPHTEFLGKMDYEGQETYAFKSTFTLDEQSMSWMAYFDTRSYQLKGVTVDSHLGEVSYLMRLDIVMEYYSSDLSLVNADGLVFRGDAPKDTPIDGSVSE